MTGWEFIFKLIETSPGSVSVFAVAALFFIIYVAVTIDRLRMFNRRIDNLVTKKDLEIALLALKHSLSNQYMPRLDCDRRERETSERFARIEKDMLRIRRSGSAKEDT